MNLAMLIVLKPKENLFDFRSDGLRYFVGSFIVFASFSFHGTQIMQMVGTLVIIL